MKNFFKIAVSGVLLLGVSVHSFANNITVTIVGGNNTNESAQSLVITANLVRDGSNDSLVSLPYATEFSVSASENATAGVDYGVLNGALVWLDGESGSKTLIISITDDAIKEPTESFDLLFSKPSNATINALGSNLRTAINITDNDIVETSSSPLTSKASIVEVLNVYCADQSSIDSADFVQLCQAFDSETSTENLERALRVISPSSSASQMRIGQQIQRQQLNSIGSRLSAIRTNTSRSRSTDSFAFSVNGQRLPSVSLLDTIFKQNDDDFSGLLGKRYDWFFTGDYSYGERKDTDNETGFKPEHYGLTTGVDYRINHQLIIGGAIGASQIQAQLYGGAGDIDSTGYDVIVYAVIFNGNNNYFELVASQGSYDFNLTRNIDFLLSGNFISEVAISKTQSTQQSLSASGGYDYQFSSGSNISLNFRLSRSQSKLNGYEETGAGIYNLVINEQTAMSTSSQITLFLSHPFSLSKAVLLPQLSVSAIHDFKNSSDSVSGFLATNELKTAFVFDTNELDSNYATVQLSLSAVLTHGISLFASYDILLAYENYENQQFSIGGRIESPF